MWKLIGCVTGDETPSNKLITFSAFHSQPGIYFDELGPVTLSHNNWNLVLYYNLSTFWTEWDQIERLTSRLERDLNSAIQKQEQRDTIAIVTTIILLRDSLQERNELLRDTHRNKRAPLDFIGNLLGDTFGVLNQRDAEQYYQQIQQLKEGQLHNNNLIKQHLHVIDVTSNLIKKENDMINRHYEVLHRQLNRMEEHEDFIDITLQAITSMTLFMRIQDALIDTLTDSHHGKINTNLITPKQLKLQTQHLQQVIPPSLKLPIYNQKWTTLYQFITAKASITQQLAIFELKIPLITSDEFQLYHAIAVPTPSEDKQIYLNIETPYVLINLQRTLYYLMSKEELMDCKPGTTGSRICKQEHPLFSVHGNTSPCAVALMISDKVLPPQCTVKSILPNMYLCHLQQSDSWIMVLPKPTSFRLNCHEISKSITLEGSGLLTLTAGCHLSHPNLFISSHNDYTTYRHSSLQLGFNLTTVAHNRSYNIIAADISQDIQKLNQAVRALHQDGTWHNLSKHDIHNYTISGFSIVMIITLIVIWCYRDSISTLLCKLKKHEANQGNLPSSSTQRRRSMI